MNKFHQIRKGLRYDLAGVAGKVSMDEMHLALFEQGMGWIHANMAYRLASTIEVPVGQILPLLKDIFNEADKFDSEPERNKVIFAPGNRDILIQSGIDPDPRAWFAIVQLKSGNERRYFLTSMEYERVKNDLVYSETAEGFLTFRSDCQDVILRKSAIASVKFTNDASYAWFRSHERDFILTVVSNVSPRPVKMEVTPDGYPNGTGERPFADLLASARGLPPVSEENTEGKAPAVMPAFFSLLEDVDETIVSFDGIEVIEIPCGVTMPHLYDDNEEFAEGWDGNESLEQMEMMGEA